MSDLIDKILAFETDSMTEDEEVAFFQELIDTGMAWKLQGRYGRTADYLINVGLCHLTDTTPKVRPFSTTGWVTCEVCGKHITEGWHEGKVGEQAQIFYCFEHFDKPRKQEGANA